MYLIFGIEPAANRTAYQQFSPKKTLLNPSSIAGITTVSYGEELAEGMLGSSVLTLIATVLGVSKARKPTNGRICSTSLRKPFVSDLSE